MSKNNSHDNEEDPEKTEPNHVIPHFPHDREEDNELIQALESVLTQALTGAETGLIISVAARLIIRAQKLDSAALQKVSELVAVSTWRD